MNVPASALAPSERVYSHFQQAIFADVAKGAGHTVVRARAGCGKTTTIIEALNHTPGRASVLLCAFNKDIARELEVRAPKHVVVSTLHAYGLRTVTKCLGRLAIDDHKVTKHIRVLVKDAPAWQQTPDWRRSLRTVVGLCKSSLMHMTSDVAELLDRHEIRPPGGSDPGADGEADEAGEESGELASDTDEEERAIFLAQVQKLLEWSRLGGSSLKDVRDCLEKAALATADLEKVRAVLDRDVALPDATAQCKAILDASLLPVARVEQAMQIIERLPLEALAVDFDDMIWMPCVMGLQGARFDIVMGDEVQDWSPAQVELMLTAVKPGGRILAVGDDKQCIPAGQKVMTPSGAVAIENIQVGDEVLSVKAGRTVAARVSHKSHVLKSQAFEYDLGEHGCFQATAEHVLFAAISDPAGSYVYLMYRPDMGFRIGVTRTVGHNGQSFVVRTQQEHAERLWVLAWRPTYAECAELEAAWAYQHGIPREPFVPRPGMWVDSREAAERLFKRFGQNGWKMLEERKLSFDHPNYIAKASGSGRVAVNLLIATKDAHRVEIETAHAPAGVQAELGMLDTGKGTTRVRRNFRTLAEATAFAKRAARLLGGYVVESLSGAREGRRMLAVGAASVHEGMRLPVVLADGSIGTAPVLARREVPVTDCYDLEVETLGTFIVHGVVVHNSIYAFRGADAEALPKLIERLRAKVLPLSITYRCAQRIVAVARQYVPDFEAGPANPEGVVRSCFLKEVGPEVQEGDFVLSRVNAPLVSLCMALLTRGRRAHIQGKNIGDKLAGFIERSKMRTVDALRRFTANWLAREVKRLQEEERSTAEVEDTAACILALCEGEESLAGVLRKIEALFSDDGRGDTGRITLSSTHKAKGLERHRVFLLSWTYLRDTRAGKPLSEHAMVEEENLYYVAVTRAKSELVMVMQDPKR